MDQKESQLIFIVALESSSQHAPLIVFLPICGEDIRVSSNIGRGLPTKTEKWLEIRGGPGGALTDEGT